jgi:hypothetical protein
MTTTHPPRRPHSAPLYLVHPQMPGPLPAWPHPDERQRQALRAAWEDGHSAGVRSCWATGWRWGLLCGTCATSLGGALCLLLAKTLGYL